MTTTGEIKSWPRDPRYRVRDDGTIFGVAGRALKPHVQKGRASISTWTNGRYSRTLVAHIVCETFHGPRPVGKQAAHEDGNSLNDRAENLSWKTQSENEADKSRHGSRLRGEQMPSAKLTERDVHEIRAFYDTGTWSCRELGAMFGVSSNTVNTIINRKTWSHI